MTIHTSSLASFGPNVVQDVYLESLFIRALRRRVFIASLGKPSSLPENMSRKVRWNVLVRNTGAAGFYDDTVTGALIFDPSGPTGTEGNDPIAQDFTTTAPSAQLIEWGRSFEYTRYLRNVAASGTLDEIANEFGYQAAVILDAQAAKALAATTQSTDEGLSMTAEALRKAVSKLEAGDSTLRDTVEPHPSTPGGQFYCALFSAEQCYDMMGEGAPTWVQAKSDLLRSSLVTPFQDTPSTAALYNVIVKKTNNIPRVTGPSPDDDQAEVFGKDALLTASLDTNVVQPKLILTPPDQNVVRPARNRGTIAWWALFVAALSENIRCQEIITDATGIG